MQRWLLHQTGDPALESGATGLLGSGCPVAPITFSTGAPDGWVDISHTNQLVPLPLALFQGVAELAGERLSGAVWVDTA